MAGRFPPPPPVTMANILAMMRTQAELHQETMTKMQNDNITAMNKKRRKMEEDNLAQRQDQERAAKDREER